MTTDIQGPVSIEYLSELTPEQAAIRDRNRLENARVAAYRAAERKLIRAGFTFAERCEEWRITEAVVDWLKADGWACSCEVGIGRRRADIVARKDGQIRAVEVKGSAKRLYVIEAYRQLRYYTSRNTNWAGCFAAPGQVSAAAREFLESYGFRVLDWDGAQ